MSLILTCPPCCPGSQARSWPGSVAASVEPGFATIQDRDRRGHSAAVTSVNLQTGFERELADVIVEVLALPGTRGEDIAPDAPLFGDGLGLDSIDALEIAVAIAQRYGVQLRAEDEETKRVFTCLGSLAQHVESRRVTPRAC